MKNLVRFSFSRFSESYDREALLQRDAAKILIDFAGELKGRGIDLGCGTGFLYRLSGWENITGIDISEDMIRFYRRFNPAGIVADMEDLPFRDKSFDYAVSNFSIHWADFEKTVKEIKRVLKDNGKFVFNIPLSGSMSVVEEILGDTKFDFLPAEKVIELLDKNQFSVEQFFIKDLKKDFEDGYSLLTHLHKTGVAINTGSKTLGEKRKIVKKFKEYTHPVIMNFKLLFVKAKL